MKKLFAVLALIFFAFPSFAALQLNNYVVPSTSAPAPYWVITQITLNPIKNTASVNIGGYVSSNVYIAGGAPVTTQNIIISGATYNTFLAAVTTADMPVGTTQAVALAELLSALQSSLLTLPFFNGATIVP